MRPGSRALPGALTIVPILCKFPKTISYKSWIYLCFLPGIRPAEARTLLRAPEIPEMLDKTALFSKGLIICIQDHSCYRSNQKSPQTVKPTCHSRASQRTKLHSTSAMDPLPQGREVSGQRGEDQSCHHISTTSYWVTQPWCSHLAVKPSVTPVQTSTADTKGF